MQNAQVYVMVCVYWVQSYTHSPHISDLSASGPLKFPVPMNGWYLGLAGCSGGSGKDLAVDFNLNGCKCDLLLLMQGVSSGLLVLFSDVCSCLSTYTDV